MITNFFTTRRREREGRGEEKQREKEREQAVSGVRTSPNTTNNPVQETPNIPLWSTANIKRPYRKENHRHKLKDEQQAQRKKFKSARIVIEAPSEDPGSSCKQKVKNKCSVVNGDSRLTHKLSLPHQGELIRQQMAQRHQSQQKPYSICLQNH